MADKTGMRPRPNSRSIRIPISWDIKKQDKKNWVMTISLAVIIAIVLLLFSIGTIFSDRTILGKMLIIFVPFAIYLYSYRFGVFKEAWVRNQYEDQKERDYEIDISKWWQIYHISPNPPFVCHFYNGNKGIFLKLKKDVIQGKEVSVEYDHYEAVADVENYIANQKLNFAYIDYMDNVGNDERMEKLMTNTKIGGNRVLENMLLSIYSNLELRMQQEFSSFDVVLIYQKTNEDDLVSKINNIAEGYKEANYKTVLPMNQEEIRVLAKELFNLDNFSVVNATRGAVGSSKVEIIRPIQVVHGNGVVEKINDTFQEEKAKREEALQERKVKKVKQEKTSVVNIDKRQDSFGKPEELLDIFQDVDFDLDVENESSEMHTSVIDYEDSEDEDVIESLNKRKEVLDEESAKSDDRGIIDIFDIDTEIEKPLPNKRTSRGTFRKEDLDKSQKNPYEESRDLNIFDTTNENSSTSKKNKEYEDLDIF